MADLPPDDDGPTIMMPADVLLMTHRLVPDPETPAKGPSQKPSAEASVHHGGKGIQINRVLMWLSTEK